MQISEGVEFSGIRLLFEYEVAGENLTVEKNEHGRPTVKVNVTAKLGMFRKTKCSVNVFSIAIDCDHNAINFLS